MLRLAAQNILKPYFRSIRLQHELSKIRNIGVAAHIDAGKTSTTECMLYLSGSTKFKGSVDDGSTTTDFLQEERDRGITIQSATVSYNWNNHKIHLIDTPGHSEFTNEVETSMSVIDGLILVICASSGVETQTKTVYKQMMRYNVPAIIFINKMDKENANFRKACESLVNLKKDINPVLVSLPIDFDYKVCNGGKEFTGVLDLITGEVCQWSDDSKVGYKTEPIQSYPTLQSHYKKYKSKLVDTLSDFDEEFLEYLIETDIDPLNVPADKIYNSLSNLIKSQTILPITCGTAKKIIGIEKLMDNTNLLLPDPNFGGSEDIQLLKKSKYFENYNIGQVFKLVHTGKGFRTPHAYFRAYKGEIKSGGNQIWKIGVEENDLDQDHIATNIIGTINEAQKITKKKLPTSQRSIFEIQGQDMKNTIKIGTGMIGLIKNSPDLKQGDLILQKINHQKHDPKMSNDELTAIKNITSKAAMQEPLMYMTLEADDDKDNAVIFEKFSQYAKEDPGVSLKIDEETGNCLLGTQGRMQNEILRFWEGYNNGK